MVNQDWKFNLV